jgi:hypothetical protein
MQRWNFRFINTRPVAGANPPGCNSDNECLINPSCADGLPAFALVYEGTAMESLLMLPKFVGGPKQSARAFLKNFDDRLDFDGLDSSYRRWNDTDRKVTCIDLSTQAPTGHLHNLFLHFLDDISVCTTQNPEIMYQGRADIKKLFLMFEVFARSRNCDKLEIQDASFSVIKGVRLETQIKCLLPLKDQTYGKYNYQLTQASRQKRAQFYDRIEIFPVKTFLSFQSKLKPTIKMPIVTNAEPNILKALYFLGFNGKPSEDLRAAMIKEKTTVPSRFAILNTMNEVSDTATIKDVANKLFGLLIDKTLPPLTSTEIDAFNELSFRMSQYILHLIAEQFPETRLQNARGRDRRDPSSGLWFKPDDKPLNIFKKSLRNIEIDGVNRDIHTRLYTIQYHTN